MGIKAYAGLRVVAINTLLLSALALSGCKMFDSLNKTKDSFPAVSGESLPVVTSDLSAFQATVYKVSVTNCNACHATATVPLHASPDVNIAYQAALPLVNFADPASSTIAIRAGNGHCGSAACTNQTPAMITAIQKWKDLRAASTRPPALQSYLQNPLIATINAAITADVPTFTGTPTLFKIEPALPAGLVFNTATGSITGTPTALSARSAYTVTASNSAGSSTVALEIQVNDIPPANLAYGANPLVATRSVAITADLPTSMGGRPTSYSVNPALPAGLALDAATGAISGTATTVSAEATFTITATNSGGSTTAAVKIQVNDVAPMNLVYGRNPLVATKGMALTPNTPSSAGGPVTLYSVVPALPAGLLLNPTTGVISGTPSAIQAVTPYTVTAMNSGGSTNVILNIQINDVPPTNLVYLRNPLVATLGTAIVADTVTTMGGAVVSFSVNPALPAGLVLNAGTGAVTGTPTAVSAQANYVVTATNSGGSASVTLAVAVNDVAPSNLVYSQMAIVATRGSAITPSTPSSAGGAVTSYSVNPPLPAGILLNAATGAVSGIPTAVAAQSSYTITARNSGGAATAVLSIVVNDVPPSNLTYSRNPLTATKGVAITPDTAVLGTGTATSFSITPALPAGLVFNTATGAISGTASVLSPLTPYTVTAVTTSGSTTATLNVQVIDVPPANLVYSRNPLVAVKGTVNTPDTLTSTGGPVVSFTVSPTLPVGLTLNATTGTISGTATAVTAQANYVITATNSGGSATVTLPIVVNDAAPATVAYATNPVIAVKGAALTPDLASFTGGTPTSYTVAPALPAGLVINATTGVVSGIPTVVSPQTSYTITASNVTGSATVVLRITVNDIAPTMLTYSVNPLTATLGTAIANDTPSNMGGKPTLYTVSPALPAGLALSADTGVISGAPTALLARTVFTVTATNTGGAATVSLPITINDVGPVALSYLQPIVTYVTGAAITPNTPTNAGGTITSYTSATVLPTGLVLNPTTGVISGTPTAASATTSYAITGRNTGGAAAANVSITVVAPNPTNPNATWAYISTAVLPNCTACHNATAPSNVINFTTYESVLRAVVPNKPLNSQFYTYVAPGSPEPMPLGGTPLSATQLQAIFDWINNGAPGPAPSPSPSPSVSPSPNPSPSPSPSASPSPDPTVTNGNIPGYGSMFVPTTYAVIGRIQKALAAAGVTTASTNFAAAINQTKASLPSVSSPISATGYDQIPLLAYAACSDANPTFYGVNTAGTIAANTTALVNAGLAMVNAHVANLAGTGTTLNSQVAAVFTQLVNDDIAAAATTKQTFVSVCTAANTFGVGMTGF